MTTVSTPLPVPPPLTGVYATIPDKDGLRPTPATTNLVRSQVNALLTSSPAYHGLGRSVRHRLEEDLIKIAAYSAELIRDDWYQSEQLGQRPIVKETRVLHPQKQQALVRAQSSNFEPAATSRVAGVTQSTLRAIAFPTFVADLIKGTFNAIVNASIQQMEAYTELLANVAKTVDEFMADNISDNQARDWLAQRYPDYMRVDTSEGTPHLVAREGGADRGDPGWQRHLNLSEEVAPDDESAFEETLVPAARRKLAQNRLQMLSSMVLMGMNRIVVTGGKIRATMGFHIDASDRAHQENASDFDFRTSASGSFGYGPWSASASMSVAYVTSSRSTSDSTLNVEADLTSEVDIRFKSDYFPLTLFASSDSIGRIQGNTAVPEVAAELTPGALPENNHSDGRYSSPRTQRREPMQPSYRPIGEPLPEPRQPVPPQPVQEVPRTSRDDTSGRGATDASPTEGAVNRSSTRRDGAAETPPADSTTTQPAPDTAGTGSIRDGSSRQPEQPAIPASGNANQQPTQDTAPPATANPVSNPQGFSMSRMGRKG